MARKKMSDKERAKKEFEKAYAQYEKTYQRYKKKYKSNLEPKMGKRLFSSVYNDYKETGMYHPILTMVKDQVGITEKQSKIWAKNLKRNIKEWETKDPSTLTTIEKQIMEAGKKYFSKMNKDFFFKGERGSALLYNLITMADAWDLAVGS